MNNIKIGKTIIRLDYAEALSKAPTSALARIYHQIPEL